MVFIASIVGNFQASGQFTLLLTDPSHHSENISVNQPIVIYFNQSVDAASVVNSLSVVSNLRGKISISVEVSSSKITATPSVPFLYGEGLIVNVSNSLRSVTNVSLDSPKTIKFFTELKPSPRNPPSLALNDVMSFQGIVTMIGSADMDHDEDLDIVAFAGQDIVWLENDGEENFSKHTVKTGVSFPYSIKAFDIDQDEDMDLIASAHYDGLMILENDGNQNFDLTFSIKEYAINSFDIADFDADGQFDLVYSSLDGSSGYASSTYILYNRGALSFQKTKINSSGFYKFMCVDLDNDLDVDIVHYNDLGIYYSLNHGNTFELSLVYEELNTTYETVLVADMNNDSQQDIILLKYHFSSPSIMIFLNSNELQFTPVSVGANIALMSSAGDYDGDGDQDIMTLDNNYIYSLLVNNGSLSFVAKSVSQSLSGLYYPSNSINADFDGDGDLDFLTSPNSTIKLYKNSVYPFEEKSLPQMTSIFGNSDWGDYDDDGDLDLLVTGDGVSRIYENQNGELSGKTFELIGLWASSCDWGDYDNDGDLDILLSGSSKVEWDDRGPVSIIYTNNDGSFVPLTSSTDQLPKIWFGEARWADLNNDGHLDIVFNGADYAGIYRGDGHGNFSRELDFPFSASWANVDIGDFDNDADLDIVFSGYTGNAFIDVFRNDSDWKFVNIPGNFADRFGGNVSWSDMDNDGDLDLVVSGMQRNENGNTAPSITIYQNLAGSFVAINNTEFIYQGDEEGTTVTADYDNDGISDVLATTSGGSSFSPEMNIFKNMGTGELISSRIPLPKLALRSVSWIDIDKDHDLDIFANSRLLINNVQRSNTLPTAPAQILIDSIYNNSVFFHWPEGQDEETTSPGLSYQIYVGTISGQQDVVNSNSNVDDGFRKVVEPGMWKGTHARVENLAGGTYFLAVQSIDAAFEGSPFSAESQAFVIGVHGSSGACPESEYSYTAQPSGNYSWQVEGGIILSGQGSSAITVKWQTLGTGYVKVFNDQGSRNTIPVYIEKIPNPRIEGDLSVCTGLQTYINSDSQSVNSEWFLSDGNSITGRSANQVFVEWKLAGELDLIVQSFPEHRGCFAYDTVIVSVDAKPTAMIEGAAGVCTDQILEYSANSSNIDWSVLNGTIKDRSPNSIRVTWPSQKGIGLVKLKEYSDHFYCFSEDSLQIVINPRPPKPLLTLLYDTIVLSSESPNGIYKWYFDGEPVVQGSYVGVVPGISGSIAVEVFNWEGCGSMSDDFLYYIKDDINLIELFPNPADQFVELKWTSKYFDDLEIFIYSSTNTLVKKITVPKIWATIVEQLDISDLPSGIYFLKLREKSEIYTVKFVKRS